MVFTLRPLSFHGINRVGTLNFSATYTADGDSGTPSLFVQPAIPWYNFR